MKDDKKTLSRLEASSQVRMREKTNSVFPSYFRSIGAFCNFATNATNFRELFPGIRSKLCTLNYHFFVPFYRDLVLSWGVISANRESIVRALSQSNHKLAIANQDGYTSNAVSFKNHLQKIAFKY